MSPEKNAILKLLASREEKIVEDLEQIVVSLFDLGLEDLARRFNDLLAGHREASGLLTIRLREWQRVGMA